MNPNTLPAKAIERRLLILAAISVFILALSLTIAPAVRERSWAVNLRLSHWFGFAAWLITAFLSHWQLRKKLPDTDPYIFPLSALLAGIGILTIWRLVPSFGLRQALWFIVGGAVLIFGAKKSAQINYLRRYKYILLLSGILLTALTLFFGTNPLGAGPRLWLGCCGVYFQPSEPLKLLLVIYLAAYLADTIPLRQGFFPLLLPTFILTGLAILILVVQRDLGTASIFIFLYTVILYLATGHNRVILASIFIFLIAGLVGYIAVDIIQVRLTAWLNPWSDPGGAGYQTIQSLIAISNGGISGRGLGVGSPGLVPVAISDFIFSALAEETGLVGTVLLYALLAMMIAHGIRTAMKAQDSFKRLLAAGLTAYLGAQSILIIGGNLRLLPLTGVTLPFVSYGGSSLLTSMIAIILILIIGSQPDEDPAPLLYEKPYVHVAFFFFALLFGLAITNAWWSIWRSDDILSRTDNPRRTISDLYVPRGNLVDRNNNPINVTSGESGSYSRIYQYPELGSITGYTNSMYGQSGLELSLDPYLRGLVGYPTIELWWNRLLFGTPPSGSKIRLSVDLALQSKADELLGSHKGSAILLNAETGEILAMASHPTFDPNLLSETGAQVINDPESPLLNRAAQGSYAPGDLLSLFIQVFEDDLGVRPNQQETIDLFQLLGFYSEPEIRLPVAPASPMGSLDDLWLSPLQVALAASTLANEGVRTPGQIATAVKTGSSEWTVLPQLQGDTVVFKPETVEAVTSELAAPKQSFWRFIDMTSNVESTIAWFVGGTPSDWQGTPLVAVVALEDGDSQSADQIGQELLRSAIDH